jgi:hypothetical protein
LSRESSDKSKEKIFVSKRLEANERVLNMQSSIQDVKVSNYAKKIQQFEPHLSVSRGEIKRVTPSFAPSAQVKLIQSPGSFQLNRKLQSTAFTWENNIYIGSDFKERSPSEQEYIIEHEKAHIRQNKRIDNSNVIQRFGFMDWLSEKYKAGKQAVDDSIDYALKKAVDLVVDPVRKSRAYHLLMGVIGRDFFTGEQVKVEPKEYIRTAFSWVPGGEEYFDTLESSGVFQKFFSWFTEHIAALGIGWNTVLDLMKKVMKIPFLAQSPAESVRDLWVIINVPLKEITNFLSTVGRRVLELILDSFLVSPAGKWFKSFLLNAKVVGEALFQRPVEFIKNVFAGLKQGFNQFVHNIGTHLLNGVVDWLLGGLTEEGVELQRPLSLSSILLFALGVVGVSYDNFRKILVAEIAKQEKDPEVAPQRAEEKMKMLEESFGLVTAYKEKGILGVWEELKEKALEVFDDVKEAVFDEVRKFLITNVVTVAVSKIVAFLFPATAILAAIQTGINVFFEIINQIHRAIRIVETIFNAIVEVAAGSVGRAAAFLEKMLAKLIPVAIGFLASFLGLGDIPKKIKKAILAVKKVVDKAMSKLAKLFLTLAGPVIEAAYKVVEKIDGAVEKAKGFLGSLLYREEFKLGEQKHSFELMGDEKGQQLIMRSEPVRLSILMGDIAKEVKSDRLFASEIVTTLGEVKAKAIVIEEEKLPEYQKEKGSEKTAENLKFSKHHRISSLVAFLREKADKYKFVDLLNGEIGKKLGKLEGPTEKDFLRFTDKIIFILDNLKKLPPRELAKLPLDEHYKELREIIDEEFKDFEPKNKDSVKTPTSHIMSKEGRAKHRMDVLMIDMAKRGLSVDLGTTDILEYALEDVEGNVKSYAENKGDNRNHNSKYDNLEVEADHSPQGSVLEMIGRMKIFMINEKNNRAAKGEVEITNKKPDDMKNDGYTMNLARHRHAITRTYLNGAKATRDIFIEKVSQDFDDVFKSMNYTSIKVNKDPEQFSLHLNYKNPEGSKKEKSEELSAAKETAVKALKPQLYKLRNQDQNFIQSVIMSSTYKWAISAKHRRKILKGSNEMIGKMVEF